MTSQAEYTNYAAGLAIIAGGLTGFLKKGSRASLIAGSSTGLLLLLSGYFIHTSKPGNVTGQTLGLAVSTLLAVMMGYRAFSGAKAPLFVSILSTGVACINFLSLQSVNNSPRLL